MSLLEDRTPTSLPMPTPLESHGRGREGRKLDNYTRTRRLAWMVADARFGSPIRPTTPLLRSCSVSHRVEQNNGNVLRISFKAPVVVPNLCIFVYAV